MGPSRTLRDWLATRTACMKARPLLRCPLRRAWVGSPPRCACVSGRPASPCVAPTAAALRRSYRIMWEKLSGPQRRAGRASSLLKCKKARGKRPAAGRDEREKFTLIRGDALRWAEPGLAWRCVALRAQRVFQSATYGPRARGWRRGRPRPRLASLHPRKVPFCTEGGRRESRQNIRGKERGGVVVLRRAVGARVETARSESEGRGAEGVHRADKGDKGE